MSLLLLGATWGIFQTGPAQAAGEKPAAAATPVLILQTNVQVDGAGIFLSQVLAANPGWAPPQLRLGAAPALGKQVWLTRAEILRAMERESLELASTNWSGAERIRVTRLTRILKEEELKQELTAVLQREQVKERGELEVRFSRPWVPIAIPDEALTVKIVELPTMGVSASLIVRFELGTGEETIGVWQMPLTAKIWKEVWVARAGVKRNQLFRDAEVALERRDVLAMREAPLPATLPAGGLELAENLNAGSPIYVRSVRIRPVVRPGQLVEAQMQEGTIQISLKVEVLENGVPGQLVRVRNPESRREFRGKVQNERTILIAL